MTAMVAIRLYKLYYYYGLLILRVAAVCQVKFLPLNFTEVRRVKRSNGQLKKTCVYAGSFRLCAASAEDAVVRCCFSFSKDHDSLHLAPY